MPKKVSNQITYWLGIVAIGLITGLGIQFVQAGWTEPTGNPGAVNVAAPINVSTNAQTKAGNLTVANLGASGISTIGNFNVLAEGAVGIGTGSVSSSLKLDVEGKIGATEYCDQNGNNCNTIANMGGGGNRAWATYTSRDYCGCPAGWTQYSLIPGGPSRDCGAPNGAVTTASWVCYKTF